MIPSIVFQLSFSEPQAHYVDVKMIIQGLKNKDHIDVKMPVWAPGSYLIREYAKNIEGFQVETNDHSPVSFNKIDKNTWRIHTLREDIQIQYRVYGFERSVRTSFIDIHHAFLSPVGTFLYIEELIDQPVQIDITLPQIWSKISTGLYKTSEYSFVADNFDILFDSPIEIGNHETWSFDVDGTLHECAMVGVADYNKDQISQDLSKIIKEENRIWGSNPNDYYLFITHNNLSTTGGLEHLNSTVLACPRFNYSSSATYKSYLSLAAHEYFHLWNVKRLRPKALGPFNYDQENYTSGLWIMEGFTAYYDNLIIRRCDFYNEQEYLQQLALDFNTVYNRPGYELQSAAAASFDAWIKQYRPDENSQNTSISYYNKGAMLAVVLDIKIIASTKGKQRLDDVLKAAYEHFYLNLGRGFDEDEFLALAQQVTETDLSEIFAAAHSLKELDYNAYFNLVGYSLQDTLKDHHTLSFGMKIVNNDTRMVIKNIDRDSAAWIAGLNVDDELIAINGYRIEGSGKAIDYTLANNVEGDKVEFIISRDGIIEHITVVLQYSNKKSYSIERNEHSTVSQRKLGNIWLSITD